MSEHSFLGWRLIRMSVTKMFLMNKKYFYNLLVPNLKFSIESKIFVTKNEMVLLSVYYWEKMALMFSKTRGSIIKIP